MNKVILYVKNVSIAAARLPKSVIGVYKYHPDDGYVKNVLVTLDCFGNAITGGDPDETISSRAAKARDAGRTWGCVLCRFLNLFQANHCTLAEDRNKGHRAVIPDGE